MFCFSFKRAKIDYGGVELIMTCLIVFE